MYTSGNALEGTTTTTTVAGQPGTYQFTNLNIGEYYVHIPASQFQAGQPLEGYVSSTGKGSDETSDQNVDENGIDAVSLPTTGISTQVYTLSIGGETTADDETTYTGYLDDANVNFTADFGFLQKVAIGNIVWLDTGAGGGTANDGIKNGTEPGISGVDLQLYHVGDTPGVDTSRLPPPAPTQAATTSSTTCYRVTTLSLSPRPSSSPVARLRMPFPVLAMERTRPLTRVVMRTVSTTLLRRLTSIRSTNYTLQPNTEATGEPQPNYTGALDDNNVNFTADFGFTELVASGQSRSWIDTGAGAFYE